jgi:hypothetical protein
MVKKKVAPKKKQEDVFIKKPGLTTGAPVKDGVRQIGQRRLGGKIVTT